MPLREGDAGRRGLVARTETAPSGVDSGGEESIAIHVGRLELMLQEGLEYCPVSLRSPSLLSINWIMGDPL